jgi:glycosyltransferase involved in cell wall biosynthesis
MLAQFNPLVSIVVPVYNGSNFLARAIDSALQQTYGNFEVIVVNDGSNDGGKTRDIALSFGERIRYLEKPNGGVASALNLAVEKMRGDYFAWLSHDDEFMPGKLKRQVAELQQLDDRENAIFFSDFLVHDLTAGKRNRFRSLDERFMNAEPFYPWLLAFFASTLHGCTALMPKSCFGKVGFFDVEQRTTQDYDFFFRLLRAGCRFHYQNEPLTLARRHGEQDTRKIADIHREEIERSYSKTILMFAPEFEKMSFAKLKPFLRILKERNYGKTYCQLYDLWVAANRTQAQAVAGYAYPGPTWTFSALAKNVVRRCLPSPVRVQLRICANKVGIY